MMIDTTTLCSLIPAVMTIQCHSVVRNLDLVKSFCCKVACSSEILGIIDYIMEMTTERSCQYGKYGSFEDLFFLLYM